MSVVVEGDTSYAPGALSCASLKRAVVDYVQGPQDDGELQAVAGREIDLAFMQLNTKNWRLLRAEHDITLVLADFDYELPSNFKESRLVTLLNASSEPISQIGFEEWSIFNRLRSDYGSASDPCYYSIDHLNRLLVLDAPPRQSFLDVYPTARLLYYRRLTGCEDTSRPPEFDPFIIWAAREGLAAIRGDVQRANYAGSKAAQLLAALKRDDTNLQTDW